MATGHSPNAGNQGLDLVEPSKAPQSVRPAADLEKHRSVDAGYYRLARGKDSSFVGRSVSVMTHQTPCWEIERVFRGRLSYRIEVLFYHHLV
jgi:hypothetical protein